MRPVPIDEALVPPGCARVVFGPPDGDPTGDVRAVEGVVGVDTPTGQMRIAVLLELDDGDLERLTETPAVWLTFVANHLHPFAVHVADWRDWEATPDAAP